MSNIDTVNVCNWKNHLISNENISELFHSADIEEFNVINIDQEYKIDEESFMIIINVIHRQTGLLSKFIVAAGLSIEWAQIVECTYGIGKDCAKRILIRFDPKPFLNYQSIFDTEAIGVAHINNDFNIDTYIVCMQTADQFKTINYELVVKPDDIKRTELSEQPSQEEMEQAEFWYHYYNTTWHDFEISDGYYWEDHPGDWVDCCWSIDVDDIKFKFPVWNKDGLFVHAEPLGEKGSLSLAWLIDRRLDALRAEFDIKEIVLKKDFSPPYYLSIKLWDLPFSKYVEGDSDEQGDYAENIRSLDMQLSEFWQKDGPYSFYLSTLNRLIETTCKRNKINIVE